MDSWFKCFHKLKDSVVFKNSALFHVWMWCLLSAKYYPCSIIFYSGPRTESVDLLPGQFIFGRKKASKELGMTESGFYKRLKKLHTMQNINIESNNRFTKITVINWDTYQGSFEKSNSESNNKVTSKEQQGNTINRSNKERIKEEEINKPPISPAGGSKQKRVSGLSPELQESFIRFWSAYPKHESKITAEKAWLKISPQNGVVEAICSAIEKFKSTPNWKKDNGQFIPLPATWLNQRRWEDEVVVFKPNNNEAIRRMIEECDE